MIWFKSLTRNRGSFLYAALRLIWIVVASGLLSAGTAVAANAVSQPAAQAAAPTPSSEEINAVIHTLQDPQARDQLIKQLTILSQAQQALPAQPLAQPAPTPAPTKSQKTTSNTLGHLAKSISEIHLGATQLVMSFLASKKAFEQVILNLESTYQRSVYETALLKICVVILLGYGAFFFSCRLIPKVYKRIARANSQKMGKKVLNLFMLWILNLLPIALFILVSYFALVFSHLGEKVQWVLLAWITAFVIVRFLATIYYFLIPFMMHFPNILMLTNEGARFLKNWLVFLTAVIVYGYFVLQVSLFLGISLEFYELLSKMLGFIVVLVLIVFVLRNPLRVVRIIAARKQRDKPESIAAERIVTVDFIFRVIAIIYLLLLYMVWIVRADDFFWFVLKGTVFSLALVFLAVRATQYIHRFLSREFSVNPALKKRLPGVEQRFKRYRRLLDIVLRILIYVSLILMIIKIWNMGQIDVLPDAVKTLMIIKMIVLLGIGLGVLLIWEISNSLIELALTKSGEDISIESGRSHTLLVVARRTVLIVLSTIALLMVLSELGVNIGPLLAGAGALALAFGLGAQAVMKDIITGFLMLMEHQIAVGDYVTIGDKSGTVEAVSIRTVRLRDSNGVVNIIPYSSIVTVSNFTKDFSYAFLEVGVSYRENTDDVIVVLRKLAVDLRKDPIFRPLILEPLEVMGLDRFTDSAVILRARLKTRPGFQWQVGREFNRRMKQKFDELNIEMPFPHTTIYFGERKDGSAPPAHVQVKLKED